MQNENDNSKTKIKELIQNYKTVFGSDDGKMVMDDLEKRCFYNVTTFSKGDNETAFFEGQRTVLLFIKSMINHKEE